MRVPDNSWTKRDRRRFEKPFALLPECQLAPATNWADLGCGQGIFSGALAHLLGEDARIFAMDINRGALVRMRQNAALTSWQSQIRALQGDLRDPLPWHGLDGLLLANVLHFFKDVHKLSILANLHSGLSSGGTLILIEYNCAMGNPAVPHPLSAGQWRRLLEKAGWKNVSIKARVRSSFLGEMAALQADSRD